MLIYRIENAEGKGPYMSVGQSAFATEYHNEGSGRPEPEYDFAPTKWEKAHKYKWVFGFSTLDQLSKWFNLKERKKLNELGFKVALYEAPVYEASRYQAMFDPQCAVKTGEQPLMCENETVVQKINEDCNIAF